MNRLSAGLSYTETYNLRDQNENPIDLTSSVVTFAAHDAAGSLALSQTIGSGLAYGPGGAASGQIVQTLGASTTISLPAGTYTWVINVFASGAVRRPLQGKWLVDTAQYVGGGVTRRALRRRVADRLGDLVLLEATSASASPSTFVDVLNISGAVDSLTGRQLVVISGANAGHVARVQASNESTSTITFTPAAPNVFAAGDVVEVYNERSRGWTVPEYNRVINDAIADTWPLSAAPIIAHLPTEFSANEPTIPVPAVMDEVYEVAWQDTSNDTWVPLRRDAWYGWSISNETISVRGVPAQVADGCMIRLSGYGRHPELRTDLDQTMLNPEWLTAECAYRLTVSGLDRDNARGSTVMLHQREREAMRSRIRTVREPDTVRVRG